MRPVWALHVGLIHVRTFATPNTPYGRPAVRPDSEALNSRCRNGYWRRRPPLSCRFCKRGGRVSLDQCARRGHGKASLDNPDCLCLSAACLGQEARFRFRIQVAPSHQSIAGQGGRSPTSLCIIRGSFLQAHPGDLHENQSISPTKIKLC